MLRCKKILIASGSRHTIPPLLNSPGVPRIIFQLAEQLTNDYNFTVVSKYDKLLESIEYNHEKYLHPKPKLSNFIFEHFLKLMPYRWKKVKYGFTQADRIIYYKGLVDLARLKKPEIVITFMHFELFKMLTEALPNAKHVYFFRSTDLKGRIGQENIQFLLNNSAGFLANTIAPVEELTAICSNIIFPMATIYNAVPEVRLNIEQQKEIGRAFKVKFGLKKSDFVLGYAGRFSEEKSLKELFEIVKMLKDEGIIVHLMIAGDITHEKTPNFEYYEDLMRYKKEHLSEQIHLTGWIANTDLYHFYCALDLGILLSKYREGNSMFLIEAMSYGVPMIATAVGGNNEIISSGVNGFLINIDSLKADLIANIIDLKNDSAKYEMCSNNARNYISENHSKETMVKLFNDFIIRL